MSKGFTVIEVVVILGISIVLLGALMRFLVAGYPLSKITFLQVNSNETARLQLKRIAQAMRQVRYSDNGAYPLVTMDPQELIFYANIDADSSTERVRYSLNGTDLERGIIEPSGDPLTYNEGSEQVTIVARNIRNGTDDLFTYYNGDYPADQTPLTPVDVTDVKYIQFSLTVDADPAQNPPSVQVVSQVQLRNLKENLGE